MPSTDPVQDAAATSRVERLNAEQALRPMAGEAHRRDAEHVEANRILRAIDHFAWWLDYHLAVNRNRVARERTQ